METYTISLAKCFNRCKREFKLRYVDRITPLRQPAPAAFGTIFHAGLEQWWLAWREIHLGQERDPLWSALDAAKAKFGGVAEEAELNHFDLIRAEELLLGYHFRWSPAMESRAIQVVGAEMEFRAPLRNPETGRSSRTFELAGKIDAIVLWDERYWIVEHKTTSKDIGPESSYWNKLRLDGQVSTYFDGAAVLGFAPAGCLYDVARRPGQKPLQAQPEENRRYNKDGSLRKGTRTEDETPEEFRERIRSSIAEDPNKFYQRGEVVRLEPELHEARRDAWVTADTVRQTKNLGAYPRNSDACERYNSFCEYYRICTGAADPTDQTLFRIRGRTHTELSPEFTDLAE